jgi:hypothetical protein
MLFQRIGSGVNGAVMLERLAVSLGILLAGLVVTIGGIIVRRHYRRELDVSPMERRVRVLSRAAAALLLALAAGWMGLIAWILADDVNLSSAVDPWMYVLYVLGVTCLGGIVVILANTILVWRGRRPGVLIRLGESLLAFAAAYIGWFILAYGLVNFSVQA